MLRIVPLALVATVVLALGAAPALAKPPAAVAPVAHVTTTGDDSGDDPCAQDPDLCTDDSSGDQDPGDDDSCTQDWSADDGDWVTIDGDCADDGDPCAADDTGGDDDTTAAAATADDGQGDDCDLTGESDVPAAPQVSKLRATPARHGHGMRVQVDYRLDRAGKLQLALVRVGTAAVRASGRCATPADAGHRAATHAKGRNCAHGSAPTGTISVAGHAGKNTTTLRRWKGRQLAPGSYRLTITPVADGARSATATFKLAAPPRARH